MMEYNGRERAGQKRRVFACRLTDGRFAALPGGKADASPMYFASVKEMKQQITLTVLDSRLPAYAEYELADLFS